MQASLADIGLLSIRQRLVEKRVHMRDAFPRQLEGDKPHHHPNQNHGGAKGKPLKIIRYHVNYPELFFLKADYSAGILLAEIDNFNH